MAEIKPHPYYRIHRSFPSLQRIGLAVKYFPNYVSRRYVPHSLDAVLLSVIVRGRGRHMLGDEVHEETGGSVAVTHYGQEHAVVTRGKGMAIYNVLLDLRNHPLPVVPESLRPTLSAILPVHPRLQHRLNRRVWFRVDEPAQLALYLARIEKEIESTEPGALEMVQHCFQIFLIDICRSALRNGFRPLNVARGDIPPWVEDLRQKIDREFSAPHDLKILAREIGVSVAYLCRIFKEYTGKPVIGYLIERRIQAAIWRLRESDEKVISIALTCGFNDLAYFNRTFRRIVGTTPSEYRRRLRKN